MHLKELMLAGQLFSTLLRIGWSADLREFDSLKTMGDLTNCRGGNIKYIGISIIRICILAGSTKLSK